MLVCKLSHYLFTVTAGCGLGVLDEDLINFQSAHRLPPAAQEEIFRLAYRDLCPDNLIHSLLIYDPMGRMIGAAESEVRSVSDALDYFPHIPSHVTLLGRTFTVTHVLIFKRPWLENNYVKPMKKYRPLKRIVKEDPSSTLAGLFDRLRMNELPAGRRGSDRQREGPLAKLRRSAGSNQVQPPGLPQEQVMHPHHMPPPHQHQYHHQQQQHHHHRHHHHHPPPPPHHMRQRPTPPPPPPPPHHGGPPPMQLPHRRPRTPPEGSQVQILRHSQGPPPHGLGTPHHGMPPGPRRHPRGPHQRGPPPQMPPPQQQMQPVVHQMQPPAPQQVQAPLPPPPPPPQREAPSPPHVQAPPPPQMQAPPPLQMQPSLASIQSQIPPPPLQTIPEQPMEQPEQEQQQVDVARMPQYPTGPRMMQQPRMPPMPPMQPDPPTTDENASTSPTPPLAPPTPSSTKITSKPTPSVASNGSRDGSTSSNSAFHNPDSVTTASATPIAKATPVGAYGFQTGQMVLLTNLQNLTMNGSRGIVESFVANGRVNVRLSETKVVCVKPENLEAGAELLD